MLCQLSPCRYGTFADTRNLSFAGILSSPLDLSESSAIEEAQIIMFDVVEKALEAAKVTPSEASLLCLHHSTLSGVPPAISYHTSKYHAELADWNEVSVLTSFGFFYGSRFQILLQKPTSHKCKNAVISACPDGCNQSYLHVHRWTLS